MEVEKEVAPPPPVEEEKRTDTGPDKPEFISPFLTKRTSAPEDEKKEINEEEEEEEADEKEEEQQIIEKDKLMFMVLDKKDRNAANVEIVSIERAFFAQHSTAFIDGKVIYPYQQTYGPVTGFWNIMIAAPSGKGKTTYLRDICLLNLQLDNTRKIVFISSKLDSGSFTSSDYSRDPDSVKGELDPADVQVVRTSDPNNIEDIAKMLESLASEMGSTYKGAMVFVDDLDCSDKAFDDLGAMRDMFQLQGRQHGISTANACHITTGYDMKDTRNEAQAHVVCFDHGNFVPSALNYLRHKLQLKSAQMEKLRSLICEPVNGHDPPLDAGWVVICIPYNVIIAGSRIISLGHLLSTGEKKQKLENPNLEEEEEEDEQEEPPKEEVKRKKAIMPHERLSNNRPIVNGNNLIICPDCQQLFKNTSGYNNHRRVRHSGTDGSKDSPKYVQML